jgi:hypothetical protein
MRSVSMSAFSTKALPVWRWQSRQWQQWTNIGCDFREKRTSPQAQPPSKVSPMDMARLLIEFTV